MRNAQRIIDKRNFGEESLHSFRSSTAGAMRKFASMRYLDPTTSARKKMQKRIEP